MNSILRLSNPIAPFLRNDVQSKLAYLDTNLASAVIEQEGEVINLQFASRVSDEMKRQIEMAACELVGAMTTGAFEPDAKILDHRRGSGAFTADPMTALLESHELVVGGDGYLSLGPISKKIIDHIDERLVAIASSLSASSYHFPAMISGEFLKKVNHFTNFPHALSFVSHLRENLRDIEQFASDSANDGNPLNAVDSRLAGPAAMLSPTVCHHLYQFLENCRIVGHGMAATAVGNCFRFEGKNMQALERAWNFTMREIIFVGGEDFVVGQLDLVRTALRSLLEELDLTYAIETANDAFFVAAYRDQAAYQAAFELKYEVNAALPYRGAPLAVGSFNRHGNFFGRKLNILNEDDSFAHTGCFGLGFERIVLAFYAQHGTDSDRWPTAIQAAVLGVGDRPATFHSLRRPVP